MTGRFLQVALTLTLLLWCAPAWAASWLDDKAPNDSTNNALTTVGAATQNSAVKHLGSSSVRLGTVDGDDYVTTADDAELDPAEILFCTWVRVADHTADQSIIYKNLSYRLLWLSGGAVRVGVWRASDATDSTATTGNSDTTNNAFRFMCGAYANDTIRARLSNGTVATTAWGTSDSLNNSTQPLDMPRGDRSAGPYFSLGYIDTPIIVDVAGYSDASIDLLMSDLYNSGTGWNCADSTTTNLTNLAANNDVLSCWDFDDNEAPKWYSNDDYTAGAQTITGIVTSGATVPTLPADDTCDQLGANGTDPCRTDNSNLANIACYVEPETSVPVDGSCSSDVTPSTATYTFMRTAGVVDVDEIEMFALPPDDFCVQCNVADNIPNLDTNTVEQDFTISGTVPSTPDLKDRGLDDEDLTIAGGVVGAAGRFGYAGDYNGTTGRMYVADSANNSLSGESTITVEAVFKPDSVTGGVKPVVGKRNSGGGADTGYILRVDSGGNARCFFHNGTAYSLATLTALGTVVVGEWYYVKCTWDGTTSTVKLVELGGGRSTITDTEAFSGTLADAGGDFEIGGFDSGGLWFDGIIDMVRVSDIVRTNGDECMDTECETDQNTRMLYHFDADARPTWGATNGATSATATGSDSMDVGLGAGTRAGHSLVRVYYSTTTPLDRRTASFQDFSASETTASLINLTGGTLYYVVADVVDAINQDGLTNTTEQSATTDVDVTDPVWNSFTNRPELECAVRTYATWDCRFWEANDVGTTEGFEDYDLIVWASQPTAWTTPAPTWASDPTGNDEATACNTDELKGCVVRYDTLATTASEYWAAVKVTDAASNDIAFDASHVIHVTNPARAYLSAGRGVQVSDDTGANAIAWANAYKSLMYRDYPLTVASTPEQISIYMATPGGGDATNALKVKFKIFHLNGSVYEYIAETSLFDISGFGTGRFDFDVSSAWTFNLGRSVTSGDFIGITFQTNGTPSFSNFNLAGETTGGTNYHSNTDVVTDRTPPEAVGTGWAALPHQAYYGAYEGNTTWLNDENVLLVHNGDAQDPTSYFDGVTGTIVTDDRWVSNIGTILNNTVANPTAVTVTEHDLSASDSIEITGSNSTPTIDGTRTISSPTTDIFTVPVNVTVAGTAGTVSGRLAALDEKVVQFVNADAYKSFTPPSEPYWVYFNAWNFDDSDADLAKVALRTSGGVDVAFFSWDSPASVDTLTVDTDNASPITSTTLWTAGNAYRYLMRVDPDAGTVRFMTQVDGQPSGADQALWEDVIAELSYTGTIARIHFIGDTDDGLEVNDIVVAKNVEILASDSTGQGAPLWATGPDSPRRISDDGGEPAASIHRVNSPALQYGISVPRNRHIENVSVGAGTSVGMKNRWDVDVLNHEPVGLILGMGTNDLRVTTPENLLSTAQQGNCNGFWDSWGYHAYGNVRRIEVYPGDWWTASPTDSEGNTPQQRVDEFNLWVDTEASGWGDGFIPTWSETEDPASPYNLLTAYQGNPGHPNEEAYRQSVGFYELPELVTDNYVRCIPDLDARRIEAISDD